MWGRGVRENIQRAAGHQREEHASGLTHGEEGIPTLTERAQGKVHREDKKALRQPVEDKTLEVDDDNHEREGNPDYAKEETRPKGETGATDVDREESLSDYCAGCCRDNKRNDWQQPDARHGVDFVIMSGHPATAIRS